MLFEFALIVALSALGQARSVRRQDGTSIVTLSPKDRPSTQQYLANSPLDREHDNLAWKYNGKSSSAWKSTHSFPVMRKRSPSLPMNDPKWNGQSDVNYVAAIGVGDQQGFDCIFDTGSSDLFVFGADCHNGCAGEPLYRPGPTAVDQGQAISVNYASGAVQGRLYSDTVHIGNMTVAAQKLIDVTDAQGMQGGGQEGIVGLAFPALANSGSPTLIESLVAQKQLKSSTFSFYHGRDSSGKGNHSLLTFGEPSRDYYAGDFHYVNVTHKGYWQVLLDGVQMKKNPVQDVAAALVAIDTGTSVILAPREAAVAIFSTMNGFEFTPGTFDASGAYFYGYICDEPPQLSLVFNGKALAIDPVDLLLDRLPFDVFARQFFDRLEDAKALTQGRDVCIASIIGEDLPSYAQNATPFGRRLARPLSPNLWIVGVPFLKNWYTTFADMLLDQPKIGFAKPTFK